MDCGMSYFLAGRNMPAVVYEAEIYDVGVQCSAREIEHAGAALREQRRR